MIFEIINKGKGIITALTPDNLLLITEEVSSDNIIHNETSDKQGGSELNDEFYHSTKDEHDLLEDITANGTIDKILDVIKVPPVYTAPSSSINLANTSAEVGTSLAINITQIFVQEDAGAKISEYIMKNGAEIPGTGSGTFAETLIVPLGSTTYSGKVSYAEGPCELNNLGLVDCTGHILAGETTSPLKVITGGLRRFAGSVSTFPVSGAALRTALLSGSVVNTANTFSFTTGTVNRRFVIAIPQAKTLVSAININTAEVLNFVLDGSITQIPDANATLQNYKVYTLQNDIAFSTNQTISVTLS